MLAEIIVGILDSESDIEVVGPLTPDQDPFVFLDSGQKTALVIGHENASLPRVARRLMDHAPWLTVLSIHQDGRRAWIHRLIPACELVKELSPENLVKTLRNRTRQPVV